MSMHDGFDFFSSPPLLIPCRNCEVFFPCVGLGPVTSFSLTYSWWFSFILVALPHLLEWRLWDLTKESNTCHISGIPERNQDSQDSVKRENSMEFCLCFISFKKFIFLEICTQVYFPFSSLWCWV